MANIAIQVNEHTLEQMKEHYQENLATRTPKNAVFLVLGDTCVITGYQTGKVTFLGNGATEEAAQWSQSDAVSSFKQEKAPVKPIIQNNIVESPPEPTIQKESNIEKVPSGKEGAIKESKDIENNSNEEMITKPSEPTSSLEKNVEIIPPKKPVSEPTPISPYTPPQGLMSLGLIGSYEVGSSDYFGPLSVVAVYVPKDKVPMLMKLGVLEAKGMKDKQITEIAKKVISAVEYAAVNVPNEKYNEYLNSGTSIGELKARLHNQAIRKVIEKMGDTVPDGVLIDQFVEGDTYFQYLEQEKEVIRENVYFKPKAESAHIATAAASIIARYSYLRTLDKLTEIAGFKLPRGVNLQADKAASRLLKSYGLEALNSFVKMNFPNTQKARTMARR